jgi:hypothetical protein
MFLSPSPRGSLNFLGKSFFNIQKFPWKPVPPPPQSFDASYAPDCKKCSMN